MDTKPFTGNGDLLLADGKHGLEELANTGDLVVKLDLMGEKEWFRKKMRMQKGAVHGRSNILLVRRLPSRQMHDMQHLDRLRVVGQSLKEHFHIQSLAVVHSRVADSGFPAV